MIRKWLIFFFLVILSPNFAEQVTVDLVEPVYSDGIFTTTKGGVIQAQNMRIQAMNITYTHKIEDGIQVSNIQASGNLMVIYGKRQFIGESLEYDFNEKKGVIYKGRVSTGFWFLGGEKIILKPDGNYRISHGYLTTSEASKSDWQIASSEINVIDGDYVTAKRVRFKFFKTPFFWLPNYKTQLKNITDAPIETKFSVGGAPGTRAAFRYRIFDWKRNKVFLRFDVLLKRGVGGGIETDYLSKDKTTSMFTRSYAAHDYSIEDPKLRVRYRLHGLFEKKISDKNLAFRATYDKLSDVDVATDYSNRSFDLPTARMTQLEVNHHTNDWQNDFAVRVRINNFQTINQELPSFESTNRPLAIGEKLGLITENYFSAAYLSYVFSDDVFDASDFHSIRLQSLNRIYRPVSISAFTLTPEAGVCGVFYGNTPQHSSVGQGFLFGSCNLTTNLYQHFGDIKHIVTPYAKYQVFSSNSTHFFDHYIFSIQDGFAHLNLMKMGLINTFYRKEPDLVRHLLTFDLFTYAFYHHPTFEYQIPKYYGYLDFNLSTQVSAYLHTAWSRIGHQIDHFNTGFGWTISERFAWGLDLLYRSAYDWRKADHNNFVLDLLRPESELLTSPLSDRRYTFLSRFFYLVTPNWSLEWQSRYGFHREYMPNYFEFKVDLLTYLRSNWRARLTFEHRVDGDNRFSVGLRLGGKDARSITRPPIW